MRSRISRFTWIAIAIAVLFAPLVSASEFSADLAARRARVMERLGPEAMLILWSAPRRTYSRDVDYEYRQESNLYYLTGLTQEGTILVLMPGNITRREILFVTERDPAREHWEGHILSQEEASTRTGIRTVMTTGQFEAFADATLNRHAYNVIDTRDAAAFSNAIVSGQAQVAMLLPQTSANDPRSRPAEFAHHVHDTFTNVKTIDATPILTSLRTVKTPYEQKVLVKSLEISSEAQVVGMRTARPGAYEYEVKAAIEGYYRGRGAVSWSYPSIVGSGPNATILHYPEDDRQMQAGELLLVDAAANYQYMSGDITRTYPVSGTFTRPQKDLYSIVLQAQEEGMKLAQPGGSIAAIHSRTVEIVKAGLLRLGLITDTKGDQYRMWFTHGATHYIGIDVHDVGDRNRSLELGMSFVIEPGIYIRQSALDGLPKTPENLVLIQNIEPAVRKYLDIGVRVEDSFLLEASGLRRLSATVPRTIDEIEALMRKGAK